MKKKFYVVIFLILCLHLNVFASEDDGVTLSLECEKLTLGPGEQATCDIIASTISTISVDSASITIEKNTDLDITYTKGQYFEGTLNDGLLVLNSKSLKSGNFKLGKLTITVSKTASFDKKKLTLKNASFFDSNNISELYKTNNVTKEISVLSSNNGLKSLSVNDKLVNKFNADTLKYEMELSVSKVKISAIALDNGAKITGTGDKELKYGKNTFEIKVVSQSGSSKTYVLEITRPDDRSDDNTLSSLIIEGINLKFDSKKLDYKIDVTSDVENLIFKATLASEKARFVKDYGVREVPLKYGENKILIKILSEKETEKIYTLTVNREDNRSDVAKLTSLKINNKEISLIDGVYEYQLELLYRFTKTEVVLTPNDKSTVDYKDIDLVVGNNTLVIKVISEKETVQEYKININRLTEEESKVIFEKIVVEDYELNFTKDILDYNLKVNDEVSELNFSIISNDDEKIISTIDGNNNLRNGSIIKVLVKDDLGEYIYTINIIKDVKETLIMGFLTLTQLCYIVFVIGVIMFICSIICFVKRKSNKKK